MIPIFQPFIYREAKDLAIEAIESGDVTLGPNIKQFENEFSQYCGRQYGVTCSNGTAALYLAIKALNLPAGSEIIVPSMTIISCLTAIKENNYVPVFCDIDPITYNVDFDSMQSKVTENTSAVIIINTYGLLVDTDKLSAFKTKNPTIKIIEDASESHGAFHKDKRAGQLGDISTFSFYTNKIVTTGEGGMVLTDNPEVNERLLMLRNLNFIDRKKYTHSDVGFNFRLTNVQCAVGLGQLRNIDETIQHRKRVAYEYKKHFEHHSSIQIPFENEDYSNVYWYYGIRVKSNYKRVLQALTANSIDYRHFFYPLHKQPFVNSAEILKNSEESFDTGILLPIFNQLTSAEIQFITKTILKEL